MISGESLYFRLTKDQFKLIQHKRGVRFLTQERDALLEELIRVNEKYKELSRVYKKTYSFKNKVLRAGLKMMIQRLIKKVKEVLDKIS